MRSQFVSTVRGRPQNPTNSVSFRPMVKPQGKRFMSSSSNASSKNSRLFSPIARFNTKMAAAGLFGAGAALALLLGSNALAEEKEKEEKEEGQKEGQADGTQEKEAGKKREVPFFKYVIIGGGTAGYSALEEIQKKEPGAQVLLINEEPEVPYQRPPLTKELWRSDDPDIAQKLTFKNWLGQDDSIYYKSKEEYKDVHLMTNSKVTDIDVSKKALLLGDGTVVKYEKCLIATGGTPRNLPGIPAEVADQVTTYRSVEDFRKLEKVSKEAKSILVIGGGFLGSELACGLATRAKNLNLELEVNQVFPETGLMALALPKFLSDYTTERVRNELGVKINPGRLVAGVESENGKVVVRLDNGDKIEADHVVVAIGIRPSNDIAVYGDLEIDQKNGGIMVNSELQARSDLYVAGDVASYHDIYLGRRRVEHYDHAAASGRHAARNMTGGRSPYLYQPMFWSDLGSLGYEAVGIIDSSLETVSVWEQPQGLAKGEVPANPEYKRGIVYYLRDSRVVGVVLWGVHNRLDDARRVVKGTKKFSDVSLLKNMISIEEDHS